MKKLLALLCLLSLVVVPAFAQSTIKVSGLPVPASGVLSLTPGDLVPANRGGVTYGLTFPSAYNTATNLAGGLANSIPYQSSAGNTPLSAEGTKS